MNELLKTLKLDKLPNHYKYALALVVLVGLILLSLRASDKQQQPAVNSSNTGVQITTGISKNGVDSRSATTTVEGSQNTVIVNSDINNK